MKRDIHKTILSDLNKGMSAREIKADLRKKGLGYRDSNLYHDIRRKQASFVKSYDKAGKVKYKAMGKESRVNSQKWFDNVFEKYRKTKKVTSKQASKTWNKARELSQRQLSQAIHQEELEIWEYYEVA